MLANLIIPVTNRYDLLQELLHSIDYPVAHVLIIDNGAADVLEDLSITVPDIVEHTTYLPMPSNLGVSASWNLGIKLFPMDDRWTFASQSTEFYPGELAKLAEAKTAELTLTSKPPSWQAFTIGEEVIKTVGLFDEAIYPGSHETDDYLRRCHHNGITTTYLDLKVKHLPESTIKADTIYRFRNSTTYLNNYDYLELKIRLRDYSQGSWMLGVRRKNDWG